MSINRPIKTDQEHAAALREIDGLMQATAGTPDGDRLDLLVTLVEVYEIKALADRSTRPDRGNPLHDGTEGAHPAGLRTGDWGSQSRGRSPEPQAAVVTLPMIRRLSALLELPADVLVQPYETHQAA